MQYLHPRVVLTTCDLSAVGKHLLHFLSLAEGYYRARKRAALIDIWRAIQLRAKRVAIDICVGILECVNVVIGVRNP